jgi:hypothetical protein
VLYLSLKQLSKQQKTIITGSWLGWALDGYDLVLMLFVISSINQLFFPSSDLSIFESLSYLCNLCSNTDNETIR